MFKEMHQLFFLFVICLLPEFQIDTILSTVGAVTRKRQAELTYR